MIEVILIGIIIACLVHFLNYCIGKPGSEKFSPYEIFSFYTVWLSARRLKEVGLYKTYEKQYTDSLNATSERHQVLSLKTDFKRMLYDAADPFFTWERAVGMCPVCFGFWISLICGIIFSQSIVDLIFVIVTSHVSIRLLSKII